MQYDYNILPSLVFAQYQIFHAKVGFFWQGRYNKTYRNVKKILFYKSWVHIFYVVLNAHTDAISRHKHRGILISQTSNE